MITYKEVQCATIKDAERIRFYRDSTRNSSRCCFICGEINKVFDIIKMLHNASRASAYRIKTLFFMLRSNQGTSFSD